MNSAQQTKPISRELEMELVAKYKSTGDMRSAHALVTSNIGLVRKQAHWYDKRTKHVEFDDLVQEGCVGLLKALHKFDSNRGYRFPSYAVWWSNAYMMNYIISNFSIVKFGTTQLERSIFFAKNRDKNNKLAEKFNVSIDDVNNISSRLAESDFLLDSIIGTDSTTTHLDMLVDGKESCLDIICNKEIHTILMDKVSDILPSLSDRERLIVKYRFFSVDPKTLAELGRIMSISRERTRQIEVRLKSRIKDHLLAEGFCPP